MSLYGVKSRAEKALQRKQANNKALNRRETCLLYTSPSPRDS